MALNLTPMRLILNGQEATLKFSLEILIFFCRFGFREAKKGGEFDIINISFTNIEYMCLSFEFEDIFRDVPMFKR